MDKTEWVCWKVQALILKSFFFFLFFPQNKLKMSFVHTIESIASESSWMLKGVLLIKIAKDTMLRSGSKTCPPSKFPCFLIIVRTVLRNLTTSPLQYPWCWDRCVGVLIFHMCVLNSDTVRLTLKERQMFFPVTLSFTAKPASCWTSVLGNNGAYQIRPGQRDSFTQQLPGFSCLTTRVSTSLCPVSVARTYESYWIFLQ